MKARTYLNLTLALLFLFSVGLQINTTAASDTLPEEAEWTPIITLAVGTGAGQVAYDLEVEGGTKRGPQAFSVAPNGNIYLLDSIQQRVHVIVRGRVDSTILLPFTLYAKDIVATARGMYILDANERVLHVSYRGELIREYPLPLGLPHFSVHRLSSNASGKVMIWASKYREFDLENLPASVDLEEGVAEKDFRLSGITAPNRQRWFGELDGLGSHSILTTKDRTITATVEARGVFGTARLVGFDQGSRPYMLLEDLYDDPEGKLGVELTVRQYGHTGRLTGIVRLPGEDFALPPKKFVEVSLDGTLYAMVPELEGTTIYHVRLGQNYRSLIKRPTQTQQSQSQQLLGQRLRLFQTEPLEPESPTISPAPISRRAALDRALAMMGTQWNWYNVYNYFLDGTSRPSDAIRPRQLMGLGDGAVVQGIPYTWGGFDSMWTNSDYQPWSSWHGALTHPNYWGPLVGKTNTDCGQIPSRCWSSGTYAGTAGIDCSGFVAASSGKYVSGNLKPGTTALGTNNDLTYDWIGSSSSLSYSLYRSQPMNFIGSNQHVFFMEYGVPEPDGSEFKTIEATTDYSAAQGNQGAKRYVRSYNEVRGYLYHRSWWPRNDPRYGGSDGPREARTFGGAQSACYGMKGQSVWYRFNVSSSTTVRLVGISGGDADLYIYTGDPWNETVNPLRYYGRSRNGGTLTESVAIYSPGTYYARVFTYLLDVNGTCAYFTINW